MLQSLDTTYGCIKDEQWEQVNRSLNTIYQHCGTWALVAILLGTNEPRVSRWRNGKRKCLPGQKWQDLIHKKAQSLRFSSSINISDDVTYGHTVQLVRKAILENRMEDAELMAERSLLAPDCILAAEHPDTKAHLKLILANFEALRGHPIKAARYLKGINSVTQSALAISIRQSICGIRFDLLSKRSLNKVRAEKLGRKLLDEVETLIKLAPKARLDKQHILRLRRNGLRIISRMINDEAVFALWFFRINREMTAKQWRRLFSHDPDGDFKNARNYECVKRYF